jgi:hypothetical protein
LRCRSFIPAHLDPVTDDQRSLGICVGRLQFDGAEIALDNDEVFALGWHGIEGNPEGHSWRWSGPCDPKLQAMLALALRAVRSPSRSIDSLNSIIHGHITLMAIRVLDHCDLAITFWMSIVVRRISPANSLTHATSPATSVWSRALKLISGQNKACATRHAMIGNVTVPRKN